MLLDAIGEYTESYSALCVTSAELYNPDDKRELAKQVYDKPQYIAQRNRHLAARDMLQEAIQRHAQQYVES